MNQTDISEINETGKTLQVLRNDVNVRISKCCGTCKQAIKKHLFSVECSIFGDMGILEECDWHEMDLKEKDHLESISQSYSKINKTYHPEGSK